MGGQTPSISGKRTITKKNKSKALLPPFFLGLWSKGANSWITTLIATVILADTVQGTGLDQVGCGTDNRLITLVPSIPKTVSFTAPYRGTYTVSTCGSNFDTNVRITGAGVQTKTHDDDGACPSNPKNEIFNQQFLNGEAYNLSIAAYTDTSETRVLVLTITCPDGDESLTRPPTMVGQVPSVRCGETVTVNLDDSARWQPYLLDLSAAQGNRRVSLNTCQSTTRNPDMCLNAEYIDDDQYDTGRGGGDCESRQYWASNFDTRLAEDVSYILRPRQHHVQVGARDGSYGVTLTVTCAPSSSPATVLRSNMSECYGSRSDLTPFATESPTYEGQTLAPTTMPPTWPPPTTPPPTTPPPPTTLPPTTPPVQTTASPSPPPPTTPPPTVPAPTLPSPTPPPPTTLQSTPAPPPPTAPPFACASPPERFTTWYPHNGNATTNTTCFFCNSTAIENDGNLLLCTRCEICIKSTFLFAPCGTCLNAEDCENRDGFYTSAIGDGGVGGQCVAGTRPSFPTSSTLPAPSTPSPTQPAPSTPLPTQPAPSPSSPTQPAPSTPSPTQPVLSTTQQEQTTTSAAGTAPLEPATSSESSPSSFVIIAVSVGGTVVVALCMFYLYRQNLLCFRRTEATMWRFAL